MSNKNTKKDEQLFHLFIQSADQLPAQAALFPYFQFMDQSIRKLFNQLKKTKDKKQKELHCFQEFWNNLDNDDKVSLFTNWTKLLNKALDIQKNPKSRLQSEYITLEDQIYIKKNALFQKWEKKNVKLTPTKFIIISSKNKQYDLKDYEIRKSRSRENFAWVFQPINRLGKYIQCGVSSQTMFDQWFGAIKVNISNQRIMYFLTLIKQERENPGSVRKNSENKVVIKQQKTLTERIIDQQMMVTEHQNSPIDQKDEFFQLQSKEDNQSKIESIKKQQIEQGQSNPNIFKRLVPEYDLNSLLNFTQTPLNSVLHFCDNDFRIYQFHSKQGEKIINLKTFCVLPFPKSLIFKAICSQTTGWNQQVDLFTVKTKISSQNTALIYQKNKSQGILYRERDFLYLRHCFSVINLKQNNTFMIDKSIDSIHHPPFMSVVRAEKQLIWGLLQRQQGKQCILIVEGWIKGGGYMNELHNKQMALKYMKRLGNLKGFLKQISFQENDQSKLLFKQNWTVDILKQEIERKRSSFDSEKQEKEGIYSEKTKIVQPEEKNEEQQQLQQFMIRTEQEHDNTLEKSQVFPSSSQRLQIQKFTLPELNAERFVIIPQQYLKKYHRLIPKEKPKKPKYYPHERGHHLWKGEWEIITTGGLAYVDAEKMQQQKKVLTYIIKRIGKNIFSGKGILNISLPVDIFCIQSNIERLAMAFGYFPNFFQRAANIKQPEIQMKYVVGGTLAASLVYMGMEKPFNPILGQTYQCWVDDCPIYFQQISHHPPIAAFLMKGRGYTVSGCVQAKMEISINSGTGVNEGIFKVQFDNGNTFYYTTAPGCLTGLTYGDRKLNLAGRSFYWSDKGLFLQLNFNPGSKNKGFFGNPKGEGDEKLSDYFEGWLKQYSPQTIKEICTKKIDNKQISIIPKGPPNCQPVKTVYKVHGRWNQCVFCGQQKIFHVDEDRYFMISDDKNPLPSHSNYRQDIVYRRMRNFVTSQQFKEVLEIRQREDRKLRAKFNKIHH